MITGHESTFLEPLIAPAGTRLEVESYSLEYPGWVWCRDASGRGAWVPEAFMEIDGDYAVLTADYDSTELTLPAGEVVDVVSEVAGWVWCRTVDDRYGWIPAGTLKSD